MIERIGVFTDVDEVNNFIGLFEDEGFDCAFEVCTEILPNFVSQLRVWDSAGVDIALVDDASFSEKGSMIKGLTDFINGPRAQGGHLRIVFFSAPDRKPDDEVFVRLAHNDIYDFTIPVDLETDIANLFRLIRAGNRRSDVITYVAAKDPESSKPFYGIKGKETIAVASLFPKAGVTTTALVLARTIILAYQSRGHTGKDLPLVGLGVSEDFFYSLSAGYRERFDPKMGVYRINNMYIFNTMTASSMPQCDYVVLDLGQLDLGKGMGELAGDQRFRSFLSAGTKVVCVPYTNYIDMTNAKEMFAKFSPSDLTAYRLAFWGIKDEFLDAVKMGINTKSKGNYSWKMPYAPWPYDYDELDPGTLQALKDVLPKGYWKLTPPPAEKKKGFLSRFSRGGGEL